MYGENVLVIHSMLGTQWAWALRTCLATTRDMPPLFVWKAKASGLRQLQWDLEKATELTTPRLLCIHKIARGRRHCVERDLHTNKVTRSYIL